MTNENSKLTYRLNACPICLICIEYNELYGKSYKCNVKELQWNKNNNEYKVDFQYKILKDLSLKKQNPRNSKFDPLFVSWFLQNISSDIKISEQQSGVNICRKCLNKYDYKRRS